MLELPGGWAIKLLLVVILNPSYLVEVNETFVRSWEVSIANW